MVWSSKNKSIALIAGILVAAYCHVELSASPKNISRLLESKPLVFPYDNTCPLLVDEYLGKGAHPEEAHHFYFDSDAPNVLQKGLSKISTKEQQNIAFVGDSNMRHR